MSSYHGNACARIVEGLNDSDPQLLLTVFKSICLVEDFEVFFYSYSLVHSPYHQNFQEWMHITSVDMFCAYWSRLQKILPNGHLTLSSLRSCEISSTARYDSLWIGMILLNSNEILIDGNIFDYHSTMSKSLQELITSPDSAFSTDEYHPPFSLSGSLAIYFTRSGKISRLEFYFEQDSVELSL